MDQSGRSIDGQPAKREDTTRPIAKLTPIHWTNTESQDRPKRLARAPLAFHPRAIAARSLGVDISDELSDTVEAVMSGLDDRVARTLEARPSSTIVPEAREVDTAGERAIELLSELGAVTISRKLDLHETIGEGGMGVVRLGTQRTLGRKVAVKTLKDDVKTERATIKLLREAWVTGSLEHPNVVPVYDVALEADGNPLIVLKKIDGTGWDELLHDAAAIRDRFGETDLLEHNLRVLMQVCNAVHFAHSRGVLHRDLKPENVMIGEFGEVYLVDWGIAVSLRDDGSGRLPLAEHATEMAGTPMYMAPEMLGGPTSRLSERTDVYLLGAILYEIVAGRPPHEGEGLMQLVAQIVDSHPPLPDDVPEELARVVRRAMDPDPDGRFESAEQLRLALQGFLQHRSAAALADRAGERLVELEALLAEAREDDPLEAREPIYHVFGECRFGYKHALEVWPQSEVARDGLRRAIEAMVEYELRQGEPEAARTLLTELEEVPDDLHARVEAARAARREEDAKLERLREDTDPSAGRRTRVFLGVVLGTIWCLTPLGVELAMYLGYEVDREHQFSIGFDSIVLVILVGLGIWARESMTRTRLNRTLGVAVFASILGQLLLHVAELGAGGADALTTARAAFVLWAGIAAVCAAAVDKRLWVPAVSYAAGYVVLAFWPRGVFWVLAVCNEILLWTVVVLWFRRDDLTAIAENRRERVRQRREWLRQRFG